VNDKRKKDSMSIVIEQLKHHTDSNVKNEEQIKLSKFAP